MWLRHLFRRKAGHPMLELARDPHKVQISSDAIAEKKRALQTGMLGNRKTQKLVKQLLFDSESLGVTAAKIERQGLFAEPALLSALSDPSFLSARAVTDHFFDTSPAETAIGLLESCGTEQCLPTLRRFFTNSELCKNAFRVYGALCTTQEGPELRQLLRSTDKENRVSIYQGIQNRFYKQKPAEPIKSVLLDVLGEFAAAHDENWDFDILECIGAIDPSVLYLKINTEEALFGDKHRQFQTLQLFEEFKLIPDKRFHEQLLTDPNAKSNRDLVLSVLATKDPSPLWTAVFNQALDQLDGDDSGESDHYAIQNALARSFGVDHWLSIFDTASPGEATPTQRTLVVLEELNSQVCNGGFLQYFFNQSGKNWLKARTACEEVGLPSIAILLQQAADTIRLNSLDVSHDAIHRRLAKLSESQEKVLERLTSEYYEVNSKLIAQSIRYILEHRKLLSSSSSL